MTSLSGHGSRGVFALIGRSLSHSFSAQWFNAKFTREAIDAEYLLQPLPDISILPQWVASLPGLRGFNVTIPYKESVIPYLHTLTQEAREIGAVNTVSVERLGDGSVLLHGHNTDAAGFRSSLRPLLPPQGVRGLSGRSLVLGSGGASKAVMHVLAGLGLDPLTVSRSTGPRRVCYADLEPAAVYDAPVIVQATPLGTVPDTLAAPPFPFQYLRGTASPSRPWPQICIDLVYNPADTLFMRIARAHGAVSANGMAMLHAQAEAAWTFWNR